MRLTLLYLLLLTTAGGASAQQFNVRLQSEPIDMSKNIFYISKVHDDRINKTDVGFVLQGTNASRLPAVMDVETSIGEYILDQLPKCDSCIAVEMFIVNLQISEIEEAKGYRGNALLEVLFLVHYGDVDELSSLKASANASSVHANANSTHDIRIRQCLEDVLNQLSAKMTGELNYSVNENANHPLTDEQKQPA